MRLYHNYLFLFGFLYYMVFPVLMVQNHFLHDFEPMQPVYDYYPNESKMHLYWILILIIFISFYLGSNTAKRISHNRLLLQDKLHFIEIKKTKLSWWIFIPMVIVDQFLIVSNRHLLFTGYVNIFDVDTPVQGQVASFNCLFAFIYICLSQNTKGSLLRKRCLLLLFVENSVFLLSTGSRQYFMVPLIAFFVWALDKKMIPIKKIIIGASIMAIFFIAVGIWRSGEGMVSLSEITSFAFMGESLYTWLSAASFMSNNTGVNLVDIPLNFIGWFLNFIPSLFLDKSELVQDVAYNYSNPWGAVNMIVSSYGNFGLLFTPVFIFAGGFFMSYMRYKNSDIWRSAYYCSCGVIPFMIFRDMQSATKIVFMCFIFYPAFLISVKTIKKRFSQINNEILSSK